MTQKGYEAKNTHGLSAIRNSQPRSRRPARYVRIAGQPSITLVLVGELRPEHCGPWKTPERTTGGRGGLSRTGLKDQEIPESSINSNCSSEKMSGRSAVLFSFLETRCSVFADQAFDERADAQPQRVVTLDEKALEKGSLSISSRMVLLSHCLASV